VIELEHHGPVALVRLAHGKVNALDVELLGAIVEVLDSIDRSPGRAVVLTGSGTVFCAGVDLRRVLSGTPAYLDRFIPALTEAFTTLFSFPLPVVAAVNGPAVAGGCVLAAACDRRILSTGARIGASELLVGVPFPVAALEILRHACGDAVDEVVLSGRLYGAEEARALGLVHETVDGAALLARAVATAEGLGALAPAAFRLAKAQLRRPTLDRIAVDGPAVDPEVRALWGAEPTTASIRAQLERIAAGRRP